MRSKPFVALISFVGLLTSPVSGQNPDQTTNQIRHIKLLGDETHIAAIKASPRSFMQIPVTLTGAVWTENYYNYDYENAQSTHFSLRFTELTEGDKSLGDLTVYAQRSFSQPLVDAILKSEANGKGKVVRLKVEVTYRSFEYQDFDEDVELVDWQFFDPQTDGWAPWAREAQQAEIQKAQMEIRQRNEAAQKAAKLKAEADKQAGAARALKANQDAAAKGDAYGLLRMGERYRDGDGVEKDLAKAKEYLQKAVDAGSPTAADEISKLKQ